MIPGRLIAIEGIGGSGKTTLARNLASWLRSSGRAVIQMHEPGGSIPPSPIGRLMRALLVERSSGSLVPVAETFGFELDRAQTYGTLIRPALTRGDWVVSDRNFFGTIAYQGFGRGVDLDLIDRASAAALQGPVPDRIIVLDLPVPAARARRDPRINDAFDAEGEAFEERVRAGYIFAAKRIGDAAVVLDASLPAETVLAQAKAAVSQLR